MRRSPLARLLGGVTSAALAMAIGCDDKPNTNAPAATSSQPSATVVSALDPAIKLYPDADLSVQEDFAAEAAMEINGDNYKTKRDEIAAELTPKPAASDGQGGR